MKQKSMNWIKLAQLPDRRIFHKDFPDVIEWEIRDGSVWHRGHRLKGADADSFETLDAECTFVAQDCRHVYHGESKVTAVDTSSFEALGDRYFRDKNAAYCEYETSLKPLKGRDPVDFVVLGNGYARDSAYGYYWGTPIRKCTNPLTLEIVQEDGETAEDYARDDQNIYCEGAVLIDADIHNLAVVAFGLFARLQECLSRCVQASAGARRQLAASRGILLVRRPFGLCHAFSVKGSRSRKLGNNRKQLFHRRETRVSREQVA